MHDQRRAFCFNSLFEMLEVTRRLEDLDNLLGFNSLFEMRGRGVPRPGNRTGGQGFNSLFEMPEKDLQILKSAIERWFQFSI